MKENYKIEDNVYAKETGVYGKSLFAKRNFKKDEVVFVAFGPIVSKSSFYTIPVSRDLYIDPREPEGNLSKYICHSCEPNLGVKGRTVFVAMRDIKRGEEVTIDYAMVMSEFPEPAWKGWDNWACKCGRKNCRGKVKGYLQLTEKEREGYRGYVSSFLLEM